MKIATVLVGVMFLTSLCYGVDIDPKEESLVQGLANAIIKECKTDNDKVTALMTFVHDNIKPKEGENPYEKLTTLQRIQKGVGWCNHQAVIFMHLGYYAGLRTQLLYLQNDDASASPHTIAEYWNGKEWIIIDPLFMITGVSREDIKKDFSILKRFELIKDRPDSWLRCFVNEPQVVFGYDPNGEVVK